MTIENEENMRSLCRALDTSVGSISKYRCQLNYSLTQDYNEQYGVNINPRPMEVCPKPKTYESFIELWDSCCKACGKPEVSCNCQ